MFHCQNEYDESDGLNLDGFPIWNSEGSMALWVAKRYRNPRSYFVGRRGDGIDFSVLRVEPP